MSVAQAAVRLGISHRAVVHRISKGTIAATKLGPGTASYVIAESEIERLLEAASAEA